MSKKYPPKILYFLLPVSAISYIGFILCSLALYKEKPIFVLIANSIVMVYVLILAFIVNNEINRGTSSRKEYYSKYYHKIYYTILTTGEPVKDVIRKMFNSIGNVIVANCYKTKDYNNQRNNSNTTKYADSYCHNTPPKDKEL